MDFLKGFKTALINGALVLVPILDYATNNSELIALLVSSPAAAAAVISGIGFANVVLRSVTTTAIGNKS